MLKCNLRKLRYFLKHTHLSLQMSFACAVLLSAVETKKIGGHATTVGTH